MFPCHSERENSCVRIIRALESGLPASNQGVEPDKVGSAHLQMRARRKTAACYVK